VFGQDWEKVGWLRPHWRGPYRHADQAGLLAGTRVLLDDVAPTARGWGVIGDRALDAIAAGALVLTNDWTTSADTFDGLLPNFATREQLAELLDLYLGDEDARLTLVERLRREVLAHHTYGSRAAQVQDALDRLMGRLRLGVREAPVAPDTNLAPVTDRVAEVFRRHQVWVRQPQGPEDVRLREQFGDDVVVHVSTGEAAGVKLAPDQINIRLHLGSAHDLSVSEAARYDLLILAAADGDDVLARSGTPMLHLFADADAAARCLVTDQDGATVVRDVVALDHALSRHVPQIMALIESVNADRVRPKRSERSRS
jgi:hypothetical protein